MPKKKSVKKVVLKKTINKKKNINVVNNIQIPVKTQINKRIDEEPPKKSRLRKALKIIWFSFGILDFIWTILWLIYSLSNADSYGLVGVVFFAAGFYAFCFFILTTLIYYIIKMAMRISRKNA